jgi:hypothetical protein
MRNDGFLKTSVFVLAVLCAGLPTHALADVEAEMASAIEDTLNGLIGTEYLPPPLQDPVLDAILNVAFPVTLLGYAFCTPPLLWEDPVSSPVPPSNAYACTNNVQVDVTYISDTDYTVSIDIAVLFVDLSTRRTYGILVPPHCNEFPPNPTDFVDGEEYVLATAGVSGALQITTGEGGCLQASIVPGTVQADVTSQVLGIRYDQCLVNLKDDIEAYFLDLVSDETVWNEVFSQALDDAMAYFNSLCVTSAVQDPGLATGFALHQNIPNPFNPTTLVRYNVPSGGGHVTLKIYDVTGRFVRTLVDGVQTEGEGSAIWSGRSHRGKEVPTGVYFLRMTAPGFEMTRRMVLVQ